MNGRDRGSRPSLYPAILLFSLALLCVPALAPAWIAEVTVDPVDPDQADLITLTVHGYFLDGCWAYEGTWKCSDEGELAFAIDVFWVDFWEPGVPCPDVAFDYYYPCEFPPVHAAGGYTVTVTEHHDSLRYPDPDVVVFEFTVGDLTGLPLPPVESDHDTWSTVKSRY